jgi:hypothetical protein
MTQFCAVGISFMIMTSCGSPKDGRILRMEAQWTNMEAVKKVGRGGAFAL